MDNGRVLLWVVSESVDVSSSIVVDMLKVVSVSVTFATKVSTIICEAPCIVVEILMLVTVVAVRVTRLVSQT